MKYVKMLGLAAMAAMATMAFVGAGTASATVLCDTTSTPCAQKWGTGTEIELTLRSGTSAVWQTTSGTQVKTCTNGTIKGKTTNTGGETETVNVAVSEFSWGGCSVATATTELGQLQIHNIAGSDNATVTATGFNFTTIYLGATCSYTFANWTDLGTLTASGTGDAILDIGTVLTKKEGGFICVQDMEWMEEFTLTKPQGTGLFVEPS